MSVQEFDRIHYAGARDSATEGRLRFAAQGLGWKSSAGEIVTVKADDLKRATWLRSARQYQLRLYLKDGTVMKFANFARDRHDELRDALRTHYHLPLEHTELSLKGWNWGSTELQPSQIVFRVAQKPLFELPYSEIANVNSGKNEVTLECVTGDLPRGVREDQLVECRLHVPGMAPSENEDGVDVEGEGENDGAATQSAAEFLCEAIKAKAEVGVDKGDHLVAFKELPFLTPRGRYNVDMFPEFLRLRGKSYDYKVNYGTITKLFLLPKPDDLHSYFVIGLDPPLRQGQTRYPFLVLQFVREEEMSVDVNLDDPAVAQRFEGRLMRAYDGLTWEVVSNIFHGLTNKKITVPPKDITMPSTGLAAIKCSLKANEGHLYLLEKSVLFVPKPPTLVAHADIAHVTFSRVALAGASSRTIDMVVTLRSGGDVPLSNIGREEHAPLEEYLRAKKIRVKNELAEETRLPAYLGDLDDDDDDDDEDGGSRTRGARSKAAPASAGGADDDDDESPDEDFVAESDSDVEEEFNSDYSSEGSDNDEEEAASSKRKRGSEGKSAPAKKRAKGAEGKAAKTPKSDEYIDDSDDE
ncbi:hypothetical protein AMAG_02035 [Allomyces macrogynus ATCC 38327]|uniref:FACT complex subunit POB3 n=1 Tax=Allomyces macrogynus (strain ATCC 38327) TaxID=578462 RepID=A0A0L0S1B7_ALLM3|nr:hypothetical protein AMAG_02035 [Allomyces macrogynus ATCC 38327]|eukprot:KNE56200.1 hypothetical protein AMAG_02035 [Allomyces macrogynus ATCC 38327]